MEASGCSPCVTSGTARCTIQTIPVDHKSGQWNRWMNRNEPAVAERWSTAFRWEPHVRPCL